MFKFPTICINSSLFVIYEIYFPFLLFLALFFLSYILTAFCTAVVDGSAVATQPNNKTSHVEKPTFRRHPNVYLILHENTRLETFNKKNNKEIFSYFCQRIKLSLIYCPYCCSPYSAHLLMDQTSLFLFCFLKKKSQTPFFTPVDMK